MDKIFRLNNIESKRYFKFIDNHKLCRVNTPTTIGGYTTHSFTPTGLGMVKTVKCNVCNEEEDLTDYDSW